MSDAATVDAVGAAAINVFRSDSLESDVLVRVRMRRRCVCRDDEAWCPETEGEDGGGGPADTLYLLGSSSSVLELG